MDEILAKLRYGPNTFEVLKKRAWDTHNTPKPATENFEKAKNLGPM